MSATLTTDLAASEDAAVREIIDRWAEAVRSADVGQIMAFYADDVVAYDAVGPLRFVGASAYRDHWTVCMSMCSGMIFDPADPVVAAGGDTAFAHFLIRCGGTSPDGKEMSSWMRASQGYRKRGGRWRIVHEHFSAPFDMESFKAVLDAQP